MSHFGKNNTNITELGFDNFSLHDPLSCEANKHDFRELDLGSPVSPLRTHTSRLTVTITTTTTTTSSSSSSSGSVSGQTRLESSLNNHFGELSGSSGAAASSAKSEVGVVVGPENVNVNRNGGGICGGGAKKVKRLGNELYRKCCFCEVLSMYDKAVALAEGNAAYRSNRVAALTRLGRIGEVVKECEKAVRLDPNYLRAHQLLGSLLVR